MGSFLFSYVEFWGLSIFLTTLFFFFFLKSLMLLGDFFSVNPFFEKKRLKHLHQVSSFSNFITPVILLVCVLSLFKNEHAANFEAARNVSLYLPIFFIALYVFLKLGERTIYFMSGNQNQNINSSGLFLITFIPVATAMISSGNLIDLLLPLELLGVLFYFIFLEFTYNAQLDTNFKANKTTVVVRGLLYYFWLSFIGSAFFVVAIALASIQFSTIKLMDIYHISLVVNDETSLPFCSILLSLFIFLGITLKIGGFFFFFFKAELYRLLPMYGVVLFSTYVVIFYLFLFIGLSIQLPFFLYYCKWFLSSLIVFFTVWLFFFGGINIKNIYIFAGLSSVLTTCFCILVIV